jgi:hypothetical protein
MNFANGLGFLKKTKKVEAGGKGKIEVGGRVWPSPLAAMEARPTFSVS